ncbi:hypothetical protein [Niveibacterium terrae]|uniref:hypothetical protein n=1 Tax=Niveibacterium terrae TaxID=3373598 RepID=UPI003A9439CE
MSMTVQHLHKLLGKLIEQGHGRKPVRIDKSSFRHPLEDEGICIIDVTSVSGPTWIPMADDDGGTAWNADGSERGRYMVILAGEGKEAQS